MAPTWLNRWSPSQVNNSSNPFISDAFLTALESSDACSSAAGWQPHHLHMPNEIQVPSYLKTHSWGEYVFDWAWAQAYEQAGLDYYPKLLVAAPFTPSMGPRFLGAKNVDDARQVVDALIEESRAQRLSGVHILFPNRQEQSWLDETPLLRRCDVQFHWHNAGYQSFDDFLDRFSSRKRKNVRKERQSVAQQGLTLRRVLGTDIEDRDWNAFYEFYHATYLKRGRHGYLSRTFFDNIRSTLADQILLVVADQGENNPVAAALFFFDEQALYGRYWGCFHEFNHLHFEACYYQGIEFAIERGLQRFDPGTQGEHKLARGFEPTWTYSYHWLNDERFQLAVQRFCAQEAEMNAQYFQQATEALPFKQESC